MTSVIAPFRTAFSPLCGPGPHVVCPLFRVFKFKFTDAMVWSFRGWVPMKCAEWLGFAAGRKRVEPAGSLRLVGREGVSGVDCESETAVPGQSHRSIVAPFSQVAVLLCSQQHRLLLWGGMQQAQQGATHEQPRVRDIHIRAGKLCLRCHGLRPGGRHTRRCMSPGNDDTLPLSGEGWITGARACRWGAVVAPGWTLQDPYGVDVHGTAAWVPPLDVFGDHGGLHCRVVARATQVRLDARVGPALMADQVTTDGCICSA